MSGSNAVQVVQALLNLRDQYDGFLATSFQKDNLFGEHIDKVRMQPHTHTGPSRIATASSIPLSQEFDQFLNHSGPSPRAAGSITRTALLPEYLSLFLDDLFKKGAKGVWGMGVWGYGVMVYGVWGNGVWGMGVWGYGSIDINCMSASSQCCLLCAALGAGGGHYSGQVHHLIPILSGQSELPDPFLALPGCRCTCILTGSVCYCRTCLRTTIRGTCSAGC